jgi:hypothetical protein
MDLTVTTPAVLFPAISLLLLAYTNRFLTLATVARGLSEKFRGKLNDNVRGQLDNLRFRMRLIRDMQVLGVLSFMGCGVSMFLLFIGLSTSGAVVFGASLLLLIASLIVSLREIQHSITAIELQLSEVDELPATL